MRGVVAGGVAGSLLVTAGGWCYARIPQRSWVDAFPGLSEVRGSSQHQAWGLALAFGGLALLTWAWWDLRQGVRGRVDGVGRTRRAAAAWAAPLFLAPPVFSGDGWSYVATGYLHGQGLSPYVWTPAALPPLLRSGVSPRWLHTPSPYGAVPLVWGGAFSQLTHDPWLLLAAYRVFAVLGLALVAWAVPVLARRARVDPAEASVLAVASPFVLAHGVAGLHNDLPMAALMLAALVATRRDRWLLGAVLAGIAASVKVPGGLVVVGVVLLSLAPGVRWPARLRRAALVGATSIGTLWVVGWVSGLGLGWIHALAVPDREHTRLAVTSVIGRAVRRALISSGPSGHALVHDVRPEVLAKQVGVGLLLVTALWVLLRCRVDTRGRALTGGAIVVLAGVLLSPTVHYWYFLWCVPLLACLRLPRAAAGALVAGVATLGLTAVGDPATHIRWLWETATWAVLLVPPLAWVLMWVLGRWRRRPEPPHPPGAGGPLDRPGLEPELT